MIAIGEEVRHIDQHGITFVVFDRKISISAINREVKRISLNEPVSGLWTNDPKHADYLAATFEMLWGTVSSGGREDSGAVCARPLAGVKGWREV